MSGSITRTAYLTGTHSNVLHLRTDCPASSGANDIRPVDPSVYPHHRLCKWCDPDVTVEASGYTHHDRRSTCRVCGGDEIDDDGNCTWCERADEVLILD